MTPPRPKLTPAMRAGVVAVITDAEMMVDEREATESKPDKKGNGQVHRGIDFLERWLRWEGSYGARERRRQRQAIALLTAARQVIYSELLSAGPDEVRQHPGLLKQQRLMDRIDAYLKDT